MTPDRQVRRKLIDTDTPTGQITHSNIGPTETDRITSERKPRATYIYPRDGH